MNKRANWITWLVSASLLAACQSPNAGALARPADAEPVPATTNAALGKPVRGATAPNEQYCADGVGSLVDGRTGSDDYMDQEWLGWWYEDQPFVATIDLGKPMQIDELGVHTLMAAEAWIFLPRKVEFELSNDGKSFEKVATVTPSQAQLDLDYPETVLLKTSKLQHTARYIRVRAERYGKLPDWHQGSGGAEGYEGEAWLFLDEILVHAR